tara:strand:- start:1211 stop:1441 length:231 start_codon:yes stop_codon:yes gene_type:complete
MYAKFLNCKPINIKDTNCLKGLKINWDKLIKHNLKLSICFMKDIQSKNPYNGNITETYFKDKESTITAKLDKALAI